MKKILFLLEDYNYFYTQGANIELALGKKYEEVLNYLINKKHYQSDSLAKAFQKIGYETEIVIPEANPLQLKWAKENNVFVYLNWLFEKPIRSYRSRIRKQYRTSYNSIQFKVLLAQVKEYKPEIIYFYSNIFIAKKQVEELKKHSKKIILQWTCPIWREQPDFPYESFDLIVTAALQLKAYFESKKCQTVYIQQAFDDDIVPLLNPKTDYEGDVIFIGGYSLGHNYRFQVLEELLKKNINLTVYGAGKEFLPTNSLVRECMNEPLYGLDMYNEYRKYKIALHIHTTGHENDGIDWNKYAGAKRLFEITGTGTLLIASHQDNVKDLFEIDKEVVTFKSVEELLEKIQNLLKDLNKIERIAKAGMERTLKDHTFLSRAKQLEPFFN